MHSYARDSSERHPVLRHMVTSDRFTKFVLYYSEAGTLLKSSSRLISDEPPACMKLTRFINTFYFLGSKSHVSKIDTDVTSLHFVTFSIVCRTVTPYLEVQLCTWRTKNKILSIKYSFKRVILPNRVNKTASKRFIDVPQLIVLHRSSEKRIKERPVFRRLIFLRGLGQPIKVTKWMKKPKQSGRRHELNDVDVSLTPWL